MKPNAILQELETAASAMCVKVSYEAMSATVGMGGLCRVKGQYRVIIDRRASPQERVATLAQALSQLDTASVSMAPAAREVVQYYALRRAG